MKKEPGDAGGGRVLVVLVVLEVLFVLVALAGLALWSVRGALVVAGVLGVVACERALADRRGGRRAADTAGGEGS
ncbi:hypothetical protein JL475_24295 [Streptomyces sp. M2CJ-2]|uniref:hypothetical protein n=1 Tax=Streptomyces sp. M2CJ-2 TaxID=2803948 RepID=UPI0019281632|nr:hypothetical protein [Streptomyces sp. M2CJ-2]MBL3669056.1 hypothetical protein [Streptomyces sp. M2CJ-2]